MDPLGIGGAELHTAEDAERFANGWSVIQVDTYEKAEKVIALCKERDEILNSDWIEVDHI